MAIDIRYIPINTFQEIFLDKDTSCFLAAGIVRFFKDNDRITGKEVFQLSGTAPNYTYVSLGTELTLSANGTFEDGSGNDITVYLFPYDADGNVELYYADVKSSGAVDQLTREGFPNIAQEDDEEDVVKNYIPNGQFLLHHDIVADEDGSVEAGEITDDVTIIAEGGWTFERTASSSAKDFVLFERIGSFVEVPSKSPRYALNVKNESPGGGDTFKAIRRTFRDVNKFSSDTEKFTFAFEGKTDSGSSSIEVKLIKNYGTGGSATETTILQAIALGSAYQIYDIPFVFGSNDGKTIGSNDDDYLQLSISLPVASAFDNTFDNFILLKGDKQVDEFPDTPNGEFIRQALAGLIPVPDYEGQNLYLPMRLGLAGMEFDTGEIGKIRPTSVEDLETGELRPNGDKYRVEAYSDDKIPYRRVYEKWSKNSPDGLSIYGTGQDEMRYEILESNDQAFGTSDTDSNINNDSYQSFTPAVTAKLINLDITTGNPAPAVNSSVSIYEGDGTTGNLLARETGIDLALGANLIQIGDRPSLTSGLKYTIRLQNAGNVFWRTNAAGGYTGGSFNGTAADAVFSTSMASTTTTYRLKSNTGGAVVAAADGAIPTGFTFTPVQPDPYIVDVTAVAASAITAGSYWTYNTTDSRKVIPWYEKDSVGTKPVESADVYRKVAILSSDDAATVSHKTALAINSYSIGTPDYRGYFFRITNDKEGVDPDTSLRTARGDGNVGDAVGTIQQDEVDLAGLSNPVWTQGAIPTFQSGAGETGNVVSIPNGNETRGKNVYINAVIKY